MALKSETAGVTDIDPIVTEVAMIEPATFGRVLKEPAPGIDVDAVRQATEASPIVTGPVPTMFGPTQGTR